MSAAAVDTMVPSAIAEPPVHTQTIGKRKRSNEPEQSATAESNLENTDDAQASRTKLASFLDDLLIVLKDNDTDPSILEFPIPPPDSSSPSAKRTKLDSNSSTPTISSRIATRDYDDIDAVTADIKSVESKILESSHEREKSEKFQKFDKLFNDTVTKELLRNPMSTLRPGIPSNSIKTEDDESQPFGREVEPNDQQVLSVHGGAPGGRQLFSSLRRETSLLSTLPSTDSNSVESPLPNGVSTSIVAPTHPSNTKARAKTVLSLGKLYPQPSNLPLVDPPKPSSLSTTRGSLVGWYKPSGIGPPLKRSGGRETYSYQSLSSGHWLSYNVPPSAPVQSSGEKRKQRDRALSTGEPNPERSEADLERERLAQEAHQQTRDNEFFKSVYSSFAPSHDDSAAIIPQQVKSKLWWHKFGQFRYQDHTLPEDVAAFDELDMQDTLWNSETESEEQGFKAAVDSFIDDFSDVSIMDINKAAFDRNQAIDMSSNGINQNDVDEILKEVSELLETLNSYQRNRHLSLSATTKPSASSQSKPLTELSGSPSNPTDAEFNVYEMLKDQLALMIGTLPPYIVTKLNSDQLGVLNISTRIKTETPSQKGLIPDESAKQPSSMNGLATPAARTQSTPYMSRTAPPNRGTYSPARPGASAYLPQMRGPAGATAASYGAYTPQATPQTRPGFQQYGSQHTPQMSQYGNAGRPPLPNGYGNHSISASAPMPPAQPRSMQIPPRHNPSSYPGRPPHTPGYVPNYPIAGGRHDSAQGQVAGYPIQRPSQPPMGPQTPMAQISQHHSGQGSPHRPQAYASPAMNGISTPGQTLGPSLSRTPEEQRTLMQEQKTKLMQQAQANRAGSGTPQPLNGQSPSRPQSNGTPIPVVASPTPVGVNGGNGV